MTSNAPTACVILIGNEILSGKTQDQNLPFLGRELARLGIRLVEARVIRDDTDTIAETVNKCRRAHTYVFTTGGIGPTHDDITAQSIAQAFQTTLERNQEAVDRIAASGRELNDARLKMAMIPVGASLIDNTVSFAPGFRMENVFVLAGVPSIARAMFAALEPELGTASEIRSATLEAFAPESDLAVPLERIAVANPEVEIGSYPFARDGGYGASLVVRGTDGERIERIVDEIAAAMAALGIKTARVLAPERAD